MEKALKEYSTSFNYKFFLESCGGKPFFFFSFDSSNRNTIAENGSQSRLWHLMCSVFGSWLSSLAVWELSTTGIKCHLFCLFVLLYRYVLIMVYIDC